jgi:hypothetical protein
VSQAGPPGTPLMITSQHHTTHRDQPLNDLGTAVPFALPGWRFPVGRERRRLARGGVYCWSSGLQARMDAWHKPREPGWEPASTDTRPCQARSGVRSIYLTCHQATVSDIEPRGESPSHRGGQGFKSPQLHPNPQVSALTCDHVGLRGSVLSDFGSGGVRFWEPILRRRSPDLG